MVANKTDIDFLIPRRPVVTTDAKPLAEILQDQGFRQRFKNTTALPIESFVKELGDTDIEVEFLTDDQARKKSVAVVIPKAGVVAQALTYLEMSLASSVVVKLPYGANICVVQPSAWVFHKGLTFTRRKAGTPKSVKDLYGIWFVLTMLGNVSDATWVELKKLQSGQPKSWKKSFNFNLKKWTAKASPRDWTLLLTQDPEQRLSKEAFIGLVNKLTSL